MSKADDYRAALADPAGRETFAIAHSRLPGPRANLELIAVLAQVSDEASLRRWGRVRGAPRTSSP